jgi:AraC-like DNA-binding protein
MRGQIIAGVILGYLEFGVSRGIPWEDLVAAAGVRPEHLADPDTYVSKEPLFRLLELFAERLPGTVVSLAIAAHMDPAAMGIVSQLGRAAGSMRKMVELGQRYQRLLDPDMRSTHAEEGDRLIVTLRHSPRVEALGAAMEVMLASMHRGVESACAGRPPLIEVTFAHAAGGPEAAYREFFGAPIRFGAKATTLVYAADLLDRSTAAADVRLAKYLDALASRMLAELPPATPTFVDEVKQALAHELPVGVADPSALAKKLGMSRRTMQRRLAEAGTSFQDVLDETRREATERLLRRGDMSTTDVAFALGYSEISSFYRAFKRWTGTSPHAYRTSTLGGAR